MNPVLKLFLAETEENTPLINLAKQELEDVFRSLDGLNHIFRVLAMHLTQVEEHQNKLLAENESLKTRIAELELMESTYHELINVFKAARSIVLSEMPKPEPNVFIMDRNGNLEKRSR